MKHLHVIQLCFMIGNSKAGLSFNTGLLSFQVRANTATMNLNRP